MLGGLVPERLARDDDLVPAHLGTSDVDILLITHVELEADLGGVERALNRMNFEPDPTADGRRWRGPVGGWQVKLEFLCDLPRSPGGRDDPATRMHEPRRRQPSRHRRRCSGLRVGGPAQATTDYYDLVHVLLHNGAGGPEPAAQRLLDGALADALGALRTTFIEVRERYRRTTDSGPVRYAEQAVDAEPEADPALLRADAVDVVQRFIEVLGI